MRKMLLVVFILIACFELTFAQTVLFSEDFETGTASTDWEVYRAGEESMQAVAMSSAPATLADGGNYVGYVHDSDGSYNGAAIVLAGDTSYQNYTIEGDVYCYKNHSGGSAYTGLVVYADSSKETYIKLVADFDSDNRFRLYNNHLSMVTMQYTFHHSIDASGVNTSEGWHHMKVKVETLDDGTTKFTCWYDDTELGSYIDDSADRMASGQFGAYSFQMSSTGIAGYFDNIVVTENPTETTELFSEDFETGTASTDWEVYRAGEESMQAVAMSSAPATLADGGNYVGYVHDSDGSYNGAAIVLAGDTSYQNYTIEGDVYCYKNHSGGSAYTGLVVYADSSKETYIKLVADFDSDNRFRLYNNHLSMVTMQYTFHHSIDASGVNTSEGWHHMKVKVETLDDGTTKFTCWYDDTELGSYIDDSADRMASGQFGAYSFQMSSSGISGYFDNIVVTENPTTSINPSKKAQVPAMFSLYQNYPNPFNPSTRIDFQTDVSSNISLSIYNLNGQLIRNLLNDYVVPNHYSVTWDGTNNLGQRVPSGLYIYTLNNGVQRDMRRMVLMK